MNSVQRKDKQDFPALGILVGKSSAIARVERLIEKVRDLPSPVFIWGESGTGKELVARSIHQTGARRDARFVALDCGAIPDNLIESELFGFVRGSFTGAVRSKPGLIEEASGGTLFLDEIGNLTLHLQAKLLRLLQEREFRRIGENRSQVVDVRFISATNKDLEELVKQGAFREDLYYRLKIITIEIPALRERKEDIKNLADFFINKYCRELNRKKAHISSAALDIMCNYSWPGNVRELQNEIQRWMVLFWDSNEMRAYDFSRKMYPDQKPTRSPLNFFSAKADFEKKFLNQALSRCNYNRTRTAEEIGMSRQGLFKLIKKHKLDIPIQGLPPE